MARRFEDWLTAYEEYVNDGFLPTQFNRWCGLSVLAGALERRVWLPWGDTYSFYPNIYVLLVSLPGDGKSVAIANATDLLIETNRRTSTLNLIPSQVTEAKFIELMGHGRSFTESRGGKEIVHRQNAGYYWASEASNSLKNIYGDFIACLTDFYDCPKQWERATKKDGKKIALTNVCMNLLGGSTFDYLSKLVNDENIMGGFASRLIYIVSKDKEVQAQPFQKGQTKEMAAERKLYREALIEDLVEITKLVGPVVADPEYGQAWEAWYPVHERKRRGLESEKAQAIMARANTNILKVSMLLAASRGDRLVLTKDDWDRASKWVLGVQSETPAVFQQARANSSQKTANQCTNAILLMHRRFPNMEIEELKARIILDGYNAQVVDKTVQALLTTKTLAVTSVVAGGGTRVKAVKDADHYF